MTRISKTVSDSDFLILFNNYMAQWKALRDVKSFSPWTQSTFWVNFIHAGEKLATVILGSREIPYSRADEFAEAAKLFISAARTPPDIGKWYDRHLKKFQLLEYAAKNWKAKPEATGDTSQSSFKIGPFIVHNTFGLLGEDLKGPIRAVKEAIQSVSLELSLVPGFEKVLYGNIFLVGQLKQPRTIAWYDVAEDELYIRTDAHGGHSNLHSIIHELSHRYWRKFASPMMKRKFEERNSYCQFEAPRKLAIPPTPKVGDPIGFPVRGREGIPKVVSTDGYRLTIEGGGSFTITDWVKYHQQMRTQSCFPTLYASKNVEEHFCDIMGLKATGLLKGDHLEAFEQIIEGKGMKTQEQAVARVAARYRTSMAFVPITRDMLETWLNTIPHLSEKWHLQPGRAGVYLLPLSRTVAIKLGSTVSGKNEVIGVGQGSMQLALVSRITGQVINKKAQGQNYFARTTNWEKTWRDGIERMRDAYMKAQGFYDALAGITDRRKYKVDLLEKIQSVPYWEHDSRLSDWYRRVFSDGILTEAQVAYIEDRKNETPKSRMNKQDEETLGILKELWKKAKAAGDDYLMGFCKDVADKRVKQGLPLSSGQQGYFDKMRQKYRV